MSFDAGSIESRLTLDRSEFNDGLRIAKADAAAFERRGINIKADVDDKKALADLAALDAMAKRLNGRKINLNVGTSGSNTGLKSISKDAADAEKGAGGLLTAIVALGPALIPIGGAGVAAIAGLGSALGAAAIGGGTLFLAFKDMNSSAAGRGLIGTVKSLTGELADLRGIAQQNILPGVEATIVNLNREFPVFESIIVRSSQALGGLTDEADRSLGGPVWTGFFNLLERQAGPDLVMFGRVLGNTAEGLVGLVTAFSPVANQVGAGLVRITGQFDQFANKSGSFSSFVSYVQTEGPVVVHVLGELVTVTGDIVQELAPFGGLVLGIVGGFAKFVALPILSTFAGLPAPIRATAVALGVLILLGPKLAFIGTAVGGISTAIKVMNERMAIQKSLAAASGIELGAFGAFSAAAKVESQGLAKQLTSGAGAFGVAGIAVIAAVGIFELFKSKQDAVNKAIKDTTNALIDQGGVTATAGRAVIAKNLSDAQTVKQLAAVGLSVTQVTNSVTGSADAYHAQITALQAAVTAGKGFIITSTGVAITQDASSKAAEGLIGKLETQRASVNAASQALAAQRTQYDTLRASGISAADANKQLGTSFIDVNGKASTATVTIQQYDTAIGNLLAKFLDVPQAKAAMITSIDAITKKVLTASGAFDKNTGKINLNSKAGRGLLGVLAPAISGVQTYSQKVFEQTGSQTKANDAWNAGRKRLIDYIAKQVGSRTEAEKLVTQYGLVKNAVDNIPDSKSTSFKTPGLNPAYASVASYKGLIDNIPQTVRTNFLAQGKGAQGQTNSKGNGPGFTGGTATGHGFAGFSTGGSVWGGRPGRDTVNARLDNGEEVIRTREAKKPGVRPLLKAINAGMLGFARGGTVGGYANGGTVQNVDLSAILALANGPFKTASDVANLQAQRTSSKSVLASAEASLRRAQNAKHQDAKQVHADQLRVEADRKRLTNVTNKLTAAEKSYNKSRTPLSQRFISATTVSAADDAAFLRNLNTLTDRGLGYLAMTLAQQNDAQAHTEAAQFVKMSNKALHAVQTKLQADAGSQAGVAAIAAGSGLTVASTKPIVAKPPTTTAPAASAAAVFPDRVTIRIGNKDFEAYVGDVADGNGGDLADSLYAGKKQR